MEKRNLFYKPMCTPRPRCVLCTVYCAGFFMLERDIYWMILAGDPFLVEKGNAPQLPVKEMVCLCGLGGKCPHTNWSISVFPKKKQPQFWIVKCTRNVDPLCHWHLLRGLSVRRHLDVGGLGSGPVVPSENCILDP